jgi:hypothetical protein
LINLGILLVYCIVYIRLRNYEKDYIATLDKKEHPFRMIYSIGLYAYDKYSKLLLRFTKEKVKESLCMLYVGEKKEEVHRLYICKKLSLMLVVSFCFVSVGLITSLSQSAGNLIDGKYIMRPNYGEGDKNLNLDVVIDKGDSEYIESNLDIEVAERRYKEDEIFEVIKQAEEYIDKKVLGENITSNEVDKKLNLISRIPGTSIKVEWEIDNTIIDNNGELMNENLPEGGKLTELTAILTYYDTKAEYTFYLNIMPKIISEEEETLNQLNKIIQENGKNTVTNEQVELPKLINNKKVYYSEEKDNSNYMIPILGIGLSIILFFALDRDLDQKVHKRNLQLAIDYPEIINKFTLLLGAGMTISGAWEKIVNEYEQKKKNYATGHRYAYDEMIITCNELKVGVSEEKAIEGFGRRIKLLPYLKFSSLFAQNMKKGNQDLLHLLELEAMSAFEERKELAKRLGEEAGTKLLVPMMIMLVIVLAIIMIPAFMTLGV